VRTTIVAVVLAWVLVTSSAMKAQSSRTWDSCPVIAKLPADLKDTEPPDYRSWFELRQCEGGSVLVNGYEPHKSNPSLTFDTGDSYPVQLVHIVNVLVFESLGGSANHVFVFTFLGGKPSLVLKRSTAGGIVVKSGDKAVALNVPVKTYPGANGKFPIVPDAIYSFRREN
jgi:hypothetical protein